MGRRILLVATLLSGAIAAATPTAAQTSSQNITVVMTEIEPFVTNNDGVADGMYAEIWDKTAKRANLTYNVIWVDSFDQLLPTVAAGEADVAVAPLAPTAEREKQFDFTSAVISSGPQLAYHQRLEQSESLLGALGSWKVLRILLAALLGLLALAHVIWFIEGHKKANEDFSPRYFRGVWDSFWWATVTITTVGYGDKAPRSVAGRAVALVTMVGSLIVVGAFISQMTNVLQTQRSVPAVTGIRDVSGKVGVIEGSSFEAYLDAQDVDVAPFESQQALFAAAEQNNVDAVVANPYALASIGPKYGLVATGDVLYEEFETFGLAPGSTLRKPLNQAIAQLQASGQVEAIIQRWQE